jgi:2'-5' RNA ligase
MESIVQHGVRVEICMKNTIRSFVAFKLSDRVIQSLTAVQNHFRSYGFPIRWVKPNNIHLTIKFLGDVKTTEIDTIDRTLSESVKGCVPISLMVKGAGVFPNVKRPRVFWMSISGDTQTLEHLQQTVDAHCERIGFSKEQKQFKGHLTLGRFKGTVDSKKLVEAIESCRAFHSPLFVLDVMTLFKSDLKSSGPIYSTLKKYPLEIPNRRK